MRTEHLSTATTMYREMGMNFWPEKAEAVGKVARVRVPGDRPANTDAVLRAFQELGWVVGQDIVLEFGLAEGGRGRGKLFVRVPRDYNDEGLTPPCERPWRSRSRRRWSRPIGRRRLGRSIRFFASARGAQFFPVESAGTSGRTRVIRVHRGDALTGTFLGTIDAEANAWDQIESNSIANVEHIPALQGIFGRHGTRPTYLVTWWTRR